MGRMAGDAAFGSDGWVLVYKRTRGIDVAIYANLILIGHRHRTLLVDGSVGVMAIAAGQSAFVDFVMGREFKGRLYIRMTRFAKLGLRLLEHGFFTLKRVHAVATDAADACLSMCVVFESGQ